MTYVGGLQPTAMVGRRSTRRDHLKHLAAAGLTMLAGCSEGLTGGDPTATEATRSPTATATDTASPSPTPTSTPSMEASLPWRQAPGPPGGPVTAIQYSAADPETLYAATPTAGVYYSDDGGESWTQGPSHAHHMRTVWASPHDTDVAYAPGQRTSNAAYSWESYRVQGVDGRTGAWTVEFDPLDPAIVYAGTRSGVSVSRDGGDSWTAVPLETDGARYPARQLSATALGEDVLLWASGNGRVFRSADRGQSWSVVGASRDLPQQLTLGLAVGGSDPEQGFVAINGSGVYELDGGGARRLGEGMPSMVFPGTPTLALGADGSALYVVGRLRDGDGWSGGRLFRHQLGGEALTEIEPPREPFSVAAHPTDPAGVTVGDAKGAATSRDAGQTWADRSSGLIDSYLTAVAVNNTRPETVLAGTECSGGLFVSDDRGETWSWERSGISDYHEGEWGEHYVMHLAAHGDRAYATTASGLLISEDGGDSWSMLETDFSGEELTHLHGLALHPSDPETVYVGTGRLDAGGNPDAFEGTHLWKSTDGGSSWRELSRGFPTDADTVVQHILVNPHDPSVVYVATNARDYLHGGNPPGKGLGILKSTDGGDRWTALDVPKANVNALAVDGGSPETVLKATDAGIYRSTEGGGSWTQVYPSFTHGLAAHPDHPGVVFASMETGIGRREVLATPDAGDHWLETGLSIATQTRNPPDDVTTWVPYGRRKVITWLELDEATDTLYAATQGAGLWSADVTPLLDQL